MIKTKIDLMRSSKKTVNSWQLINQRNISVKTMKWRPSRLRETRITVSQRICIVDKLHPTGKPLHSHFWIVNQNNDLSEKIFREIFPRYDNNAIERRKKKKKRADQRLCGLNRIGFDTQLVGPENRMVSISTSSGAESYRWKSGTLRVKMLKISLFWKLSLSSRLCIVYMGHAISAVKKNATFIFFLFIRNIKSGSFYGSPRTWFA